MAGGADTGGVDTGLVGLCLARTCIACPYSTSGCPHGLRVSWE